MLLAELNIQNESLPKMLSLNTPQKYDHPWKIRTQHNRIVMFQNENALSSAESDYSTLTSELRKRKAGHSTDSMMGRSNWNQLSDYQ